jgi:dolichyl-phosphate-mannose--protein O-mannosyl transferase
MRSEPRDGPPPPRWLSYLTLGGIVVLVLARAQGVVTWGQFVLIWIIGSAVLCLWALIRYRDRRR